MIGLKIVALFCEYKKLRKKWKVKKKVDVNQRSHLEIFYLTFCLELLFLNLPLFCKSSHIVMTEFINLEEKFW
jgi:hypothetical protein